MEDELPHMTPSEPTVGVTRRSRDALPLYHMNANFGNDVLQTLLSLEPPLGARPPSYRSRLSQGWAASMRDASTTVAEDGEQAGKHAAERSAVEEGKDKVGQVGQVEQVEQG